MMASLFGALVDNSSEDKTSRLMRGSVAIVMEDMIAAYCLQLLLKDSCFLSSSQTRINLQTRNIVLRNEKGVSGEFCWWKL